MEIFSAFLSPHKVGRILSAERNMRGEFFFLLHISHPITIFILFRSSCDNLLKYLENTMGPIAVNSFRMVTFTTLNLFHLFFSNRFALSKYLLISLASKMFKLICDFGCMLTPNPGAHRFTLQNTQRKILTALRTKNSTEI